MKESSDNREFARSQLSHLIGRSDDVELTYQDLNASHNPRGQLTTSERLYLFVSTLEGNGGHRPASSAHQPSTKFCFHFLRTFVSRLTAAVERSRLGTLTGDADRAPNGARFGI